MCGITGIVQFDGAQWTDTVRRMTRTLAHRGPDDEGVHVEPGVGLGHRRLRYSTCRLVVINRWLRRTVRYGSLTTERSTTFASCVANWNSTGMYSGRSQTPKCCCMRTGSGVRMWERLEGFFAWRCGIALNAV